MRSIAATLWFVLAVTGATAQESGQQRHPAPPPRDVTLETLANPKALRVLQAPGKVLFADGFESRRSLTKYFEIRGLKAGRARLEIGAGSAHRGRGAMRFDAPAAKGASSGSGASGWLGAGGYERVYFRRYIRFGADYDQGNLNHTGGGLAAIAGKGKWDEMGKAGVRPRGDDRFTAGFEPWRDWGRAPAPGFMCIYAYWMDMKRDRDGNWWGNLLQPSRKRRRVPARGKWVCLEQMFAANTPGKTDGELAAWIDGELYLHMKGFRWRSDERVKIKRFNIGIYIHHAERDNTVWYDDVVLSKGYIGPVKSSQTKR